MRPLKSVLSDAANWLARPLGVAVVPARKWDALRADPEETFRFGGHDYPFFLHHYNCGRHPEFASERTVELPLADRWLSRAPAERVLEVGAVTPYYWPGRVARVVDPADAHSQVTDHSSVDYERLVDDASLIVDLRNATGVKGTASDKVFKL